MRMLNLNIYETLCKKRLKIMFFGDVSDLFQNS